MREAPAISKVAASQQLHDRQRVLFAEQVLPLCTNLQLYADVVVGMATGSIRKTPQVSQGEVWVHPLLMQFGEKHDRENH